MNIALRDRGRSGWRRATVAIVAALAPALLQGAENPYESAVGPVPASPQRAGDPAAGYEALVNRAYVTCGLPRQAHRRSVGPADPADRLPGRGGRNAELHYSQTAYVAPSGVELVTSNCLACHAARFDGKLVIGLGNETLDFTRDPVVAVERAGAYVNGDAEAAEWAKWADRIAAIAPYMRTDTIGVNPAPNLTLALIAHRDPETLAWLDPPGLALPPRTPLPVSVPPWWRMKKKHAMFYHATGRGDHARLMVMKSLLCTDDIAEARAIDEYFPDIRAYISSLEPPVWPDDVNRALAAEGETVFQRNCGACHGTYGDSPTYPNLVVAVDVVGTDRAYADQAVDGWTPYADWFNRSFYGELSRAAPARGYVAPPLDGIWATGPYLHNGSVPTIAALLDSATRPRFWSRSRGDDAGYDRAALGWRFEILDHGKDGARRKRERRRIYDTTLPGYGNQGHTFGDGLGAAERAAVLEYLKTL